MSGNVVGVMVSMLNAIAMMQLDNTLPQNVNFAIQTPIVLNFLSTKGIFGGTGHHAEARSDAA
jgi:type III secretory pathway component EscS